MCVFSEDEEEDEEVTELKAGPETDLQEEEESKETKEGKRVGLSAFARLANGAFTLQVRMPGPNSSLIDPSYSAPAGLSSHYIIWVQTAVRFDFC